MLNWLRRRSLSTLLIGMGLAIPILIALLNSSIFAHKFHESAQSALVAKAASLTAVALQAKEHQALAMSNGSLNLAELSTEAKQLVAAGGDYHNTRFYASLPIVTGWTSAMQAATEEGIDFRVVAHEARNIEHEPEPGSFSDQLLTQLERQLAEGGEEHISQWNEQTDQVHFLRAIRIDADCLSCHGAPRGKHDPDMDGKDVLGFSMENWQEGDMHGAFEVVLPLAESRQQVRAAVLGAGAWTLAILVAVSLLSALVNRRWIAKPIAAAAEFASGIAHGDLTAKCSAQGAGEVAGLIASLGAMGETLRTLIRSIAENARTLASASTQLSATATQLTNGAESTTTQTATVAAAGEQMAANLRTMTEATGQLRTVVGSVSHAAEQMSQSISEISRSSGTSAQNANEAATLVDDSGKRMQDLSTAANEIHRAIEVVQNIAGQTNLLALNATIEAAHAGEAGRGFAIVANEVKALARQTAQATEEIRRYVTAIQGTTGPAIEVIARIGDSVRAVSGVTQTIASAVAEQAVSTRQIAQDISQTSQSTEVVASGVSQSSEASAEIARGLASVNDNARQTALAAEETQRASAALSMVAEQLAATVAQFRT